MSFINVAKITKMLLRSPRKRSRLKQFIAATRQERTDEIDVSLDAGRIQTRRQMTECQVGRESSRR